MKISGTVIVVSCLALAGSIGCSQPTNSDSTTLPLRSVDDTAVPVEVISGTGTVTITGGTIKGSSYLTTCTYSISRAGSTETFVGTTSPCALALGAQITVNLNLGGPPWPSGVHSYHFD